MGIRMRVWKLPDFMLFTLLLLFCFQEIYSDNELYVSNGTNILKVNLETKDVTVLPLTGHKIVAMTADTGNDLLFWSDNVNESSSIYRSVLNGTQQEVIITDMSECNGLSVDWISKHLYWTDAKRKMVEMANYDGSGRRIVARARLDKPQGIIADPIFGYIFWADAGNKVLERARLDGTDRRDIVQGEMTWPNQIAISYATRRVYWVDAWTQTIMSCDLNGQNILIERNISKASLGSALFGLVVIGNKAYVSAWYDTAIHSTHVATKTGISLKVTSGLGKDKLYSLLSTEKSVQPNSYHPCGEDRATCSHLCLPLGGTTHRCSCPTLGGLALARNGKTCKVPEELLFYTMKDSGEVGFVSLEGSRTPDGTIVAFSCHPTAVTYDPLHQIVYWSDVLEKVIYRAKLDGTKKEVFMNSSQGVGLVEGLAFDWIRQRLYFTNTGQSLPKTDGAVYKWHRIEMISVDKSKRLTVVTDVEKPRGLAIDVNQGYLYYTDWGKKPRVISTWLDGSNPRILLDEDISNPNGLATSHGNVYVADSNFNNRSSAAKLLVYESDSSSWKTFLAGTVKIPMGVAVHSDRLYYTDWGSDTADDNIGSILLHDLRFGTSTVRMLTGDKPTGLFYSSRTEELDDTDPWFKSECSDICIPLPKNIRATLKPEGRGYQCVCGDGHGKVLGPDYKTCIVPQKFLLLADLNTIKMLSFQDNTSQTMKTVIRGNLDSNYVALTFNPDTETAYWSDLSSNSILSANLKNPQIQVVYSGEYAIDSIAMETETERLYWTAYNNASGHIARMSLKKGRESYKEIVTRLDSPRAIVIHTQKRWLFWTEYGLGSGVPAVKRSKTSGHHKVTLMDSGLFWPNGLALYRDVLYVADGFYRRIHSLSLDGSNQKELVYISGSMDHVFGLSIHGNALFYTDWFTNGTYMVDMVTGIRETVAKNLYRPTAIFTHSAPHSTDATHCTTGLHDCTSVCVPLPIGYHCTCPVGQTVSRITRQCEKALEPWKATDSFRCGDQCHKEAKCAQLVPTLQFQCVCKPGYYGNGQKCTECRVNTFKYALSNDSCTPCPERKGTRGTTGAVDCVCRDKDAKINNGDCIVPTSAPVKTSRRKTTSRRPLITLPRLFTTSQPEIHNVVPVTQHVLREENTDSSSNYIPGEGEVEEAVYDRAPGRPYFVNCPSQTVELVLPTGSNMALLAIRWVAKDHLGHQIPMKANYPIRDGYIPLRWMGNHFKGRHILVFEATDNWQQLTTCQFHVVVKDLQPPLFSYCQHNVVIETSNLLEKVEWLPPKVTDNVGIQLLHESHKSGTDFSTGVTIVNYTAVDVAGNKASCNFSVTIQQEVDCELPALKHGVFVCGQDPEQLHICYLICNKGYARSPLAIFNRAYNCLLKEDIKRLTLMLERQQPCLARSKPSLVRKEFMLTFLGPCDSQNSALIANLTNAVIEYLSARHFCTEPLCELSNVSINCGTTTHSQARSRQTRSNVVNFFVVKWNITIEVSHNLTQSTVDSILLGLELELMKLASSISLYVWGKNYNSMSSSVRTGAVMWVCQAGQVKVDGSCVKCPEGTMHNLSRGICEMCPAGTYQDSPGHYKCKLCDSEGATSTIGSIQPSECIPTPSIDEMSKFLIIATCCFGFLFLTVVLFMYYHFHKQKTGAPTSRNTLSRTNRQAVSNVYAPSPVLSKPKFLQGDTDTRTLGNVTNGSLYSNSSRASRDLYGNKREYVNADFINRDISSLRSNSDYRSLNNYFSSKEYINANNEYEDVESNRGTPKRNRGSLRGSVRTASSNEMVYREPEPTSLRRLHNNKRSPIVRIKNNMSLATSDVEDNNV